VQCAPVAGTTVMVGADAEMEGARQSGGNLTGRKNEPVGKCAFRSGDGKIKERLCRRCSWPLHFDDPGMAMEGCVIA